MNLDAYHELIDRVAGAAWRAAFGDDRPATDDSTVLIDVVAIVEPLLSSLWPVIEALSRGGLAATEAAAWRPVVRRRLLDEIDAALRHPDSATAARRFYALVMFGLDRQLVTLGDVHQTINTMASDDFGSRPHDQAP
jgi:hypothetical protein